MICVSLLIFLLLEFSNKIDGAERMNILFLASDDMRPELGAYSGEASPTPVHPKVKSHSLSSI